MKRNSAQRHRKCKNKTKMRGMTKNNKIKQRKRSKKTKILSEPCPIAFHLTTSISCWIQYSSLETQFTVSHGKARFYHTIVSHLELYSRSSIPFEFIHSVSFQMVQFLTFLVFFSPHLWFHAHISLRKKPCLIDVQYTADNQQNKKLFDGKTAEQNKILQLII